MVFASADAISPLTACFCYTHSLKPQLLMAYMNFNSWKRIWICVFGLNLATAW